MREEMNIEKHITSEETRRRFARAAEPSMAKIIEEKKARSPGQQPGQKGRTPQFNVTIYDREELDALAEAFDRPRSEVINLALARLARKQGLWDSAYDELFYECSIRLLRILIYEFEFPFEVAASYLEEQVRGIFPGRSFCTRLRFRGKTKGELRKHFERAIYIVYVRDWKKGSPRERYELPDCQWGPPVDK